MMWEGPGVGTRHAHTGTEYMVFRLLRKRSVASMNRLSMGDFCERRSFTCGGTSAAVRPRSARRLDRHILPGRVLGWAGWGGAPTLCPGTPPCCGVQGC